LLQLLAKQSIYKIYISTQNKPPNKNPTGGSRNTHYMEECMGNICEEVI